MTAGDELESEAPEGRSGRVRLLLRAAIPVLSLAGMADSAYLSFIHYRGGGYFCAGLGDCDYVNSSRYAELAGVSVAALGFLVYAAIFGLAMVRNRGGELSYTVAPLGIFGLSLAGVLASAYFTYIELFVLYAI